MPLDPLQQPQDDGLAELDDGWGEAAESSVNVVSAVDESGVIAVWATDLPTDEYATAAPTVAGRGGVPAVTVEPSPRRDADCTQQWTVLSPEPALSPAFEVRRKRPNERITPGMMNAPSLPAAAQTNAFDDEHDIELLARTTEVRLSSIPAAAHARIDETAREMYQLFFDGEYGAALVLSETVLADSPGHAMALAVAAECRTLIDRKTLAPRLSTSVEDLKNYPLDPTSAFVLSLFDGVTPIETIADMSGLSVDKVASLVELFKKQGLITTRNVR